MSATIFLIKSFLIGFAIAAPVGPIGILCIRKTMEIGFIGAIAVGLGASLADSLYALIGITGLTIISNFLIEKEILIKLIGGTFLLYLAYKEFQPSTKSARMIVNNNKRFIKLASQTFLLTITNPITIIAFIAIFAGLGDNNITFMKTIWMVIGVFLGSMTWWVILGKITVKAHGYMSKNWIEHIRYLSVLILDGFGIWSIFSVI
jgi:putative LysE/RhtB family amino acid efflux pump